MTSRADLTPLKLATEDFDEDDLYAAMDELNGQWVGIEKRLYQQNFPEGSRWCSTI